MSDMSMNIISYMFENKSTLSKKKGKIFKKRKHFFLPLLLKAWCECCKCTWSDYLLGLVVRLPRNCESYWPGEG